MHRACLHAFPAADALQGIDLFGDVDIHLADLFAFPTVDTFLMVHVVPVKRNLVKQGIECTKWADPLAKRAV